MSRSILVIALFSLVFSAGVQAGGSSSKSLDDILRSITARKVYTTVDEPAAVVDSVAAEREKESRASNTKSHKSEIAVPVTTGRRLATRDDIADVVDAVGRERATGYGETDIRALIASETATLPATRPKRSASATNEGRIQNVASTNSNAGPSTANSNHQPIVDLDGESVAPLASKKKTAKKPEATFAPVVPDKSRNVADVYTFGPTKKGMTLSEVAESLLPSEDVSIAQMMWALYKKNKQVFVNEDITRMKSQSVLNVPSLEEIQAISKETAEANLSRLRTLPNRTASIQLNTAL